MIKWLCSYMFGGHKACEDKFHDAQGDFLKRLKVNDKYIAMEKEVASLNQQIIMHLSQIQELKAVNDYQTFQLEQKIKELEEENKSLKEKVSSFEDNFVRLDKYIEDLEDKYAKLLRKVTTPRYANAEGMILPLGPIVKDEEIISKDDNGNTDNSATDQKD